MTATCARKRFTLVLLKPSHYDDDGYVIQWYRSAIPCNTLAVLNGLALDCQQRRVLGDDVDIDILCYDEVNVRIPVDRLIRRLRNEPSLVAMVGVQSNQFPRTMDVARRFRAAGIQVCIGGFHVSGCLAMLPELTPELQEALDLGISLFAGEAEGRVEQVLRDASVRQLKPIYNFLKEPPDIAGHPLPTLSAGQISRITGRIASFDAGRGCPFECSFCTIINVQGRKSRRRSPEDVEAIVRQNLAQGINRFFITDDNFARNGDWEVIFDRLIAMREQEKLNIKFVLQVDTMCHRIPRFIEKASRAGVARVFIGLETINADSLASVNKKHNKIADYREMLLQWKRGGVTVFAGYILGFPNDTPESIARDIQTLQRELPIDLVEFHNLTPLPGSRDHRDHYASGAYLDPDLNKYDLEHVTTKHPTMSTEQWEAAYWDAWKSYYSPEHFERVMRRAVATGLNAGNLLLLLIWYYTSIVLEKIDPLQGGYIRRKYRKDRRPTMPIEGIWSFYPRLLSEFVLKHARILGLILRFGLFRMRLKRDPGAQDYRDVSLTRPRAHSQSATI